MKKSNTDTTFREVSDFFFPDDLDKIKPCRFTIFKKLVLESAKENPITEEKANIILKKVEKVINETL
jgi:hypothetical protein